MPLEPDEVPGEQGFDGFAGCHIHRYQFYNNLELFSSMASLQNTWSKGISEMKLKQQSPCSIGP
jgi:hypothetical protein